MASSHPNVVTLHRVFDSPTDPYVYIVLEYCPDGDLFSMVIDSERYLMPPEPYVQDRSRTDGCPVPESPEYVEERVKLDNLIKTVYDQILSAIEYCHSLGLYHRDIKPENILCSADGQRVYLADFGLATGERYSTDFGCGSSFYMSPECQDGAGRRLTQYSTAANDVWSLGIILITLVCARNPWKEAVLTDDTFREYAKNPDFLLDILPISRALNDVLKRVFCIDEEKRCTVSELRASIRGVPRLTASNYETWERLLQRGLLKASRPKEHAQVPVEKNTFSNPDTNSSPSPSPVHSPPNASWDYGPKQGKFGQGLGPFAPTSSDDSWRILEKGRPR
ncbi:Serine/threonine protein kinase [Malassezia cuniculi]|uniref:non-specific serine/threonine protein kinase n=1 Tax=Malassezia cuniculi TaxID=948313 RepID=A0AAF0EUS1_9BASI|nr:Serine/threonine protein kinase [Malassezia cuniculi]